MRKSLKPALRARIIARDHQTCTYCRRESPSPTEGPDGHVWQVDHVMPLSAGGSSDERNLVLSCRSCNYLKGSALPTDNWQERVRSSRKPHQQAHRPRRSLYGESTETLVHSKECAKRLGVKHTTVRAYVKMGFIAGSPVLGCAKNGYVLRVDEAIQDLFQQGHVVIGQRLSAALDRPLPTTLTK